MLNAETGPKTKFHFSRLSYQEEFWFLAHFRHLAYELAFLSVKNEIYVKNKPKNNIFSRFGVIWNFDPFHFGTQFRPLSVVVGQFEGLHRIRSVQIDLGTCFFVNFLEPCEEDPKKTVFGTFWPFLTLPWLRERAITVEPEVLDPSYYIFSRSPRHEESEYVVGF